MILSHLEVEALSPDALERAFDDRVARVLSRSLAAVFVADVGTQTWTFAGSATLVSYSNRVFLLTAEHLLSEFAHWGRLGFATPYNQTVRLYQRDSLHIWALLRGPDPARGPDVAMVEIPEPDASAVKLESVVYSLDLREGEASAQAPRPDADHWMVVGCAAERHEFASTTGRINAAAFCGDRVPLYSKHDGLDYVRIEFNRSTQTHLPRDFKGVSGGALWRMQIRKDPESCNLWWDESATLEGVAFYQSDIVNDSDFIICHGRHTLYNRLLPLVSASSF